MPHDGSTTQSNGSVFRIIEPQSDEAPAASVRTDRTGEQPDLSGEVLPTFLEYEGVTGVPFTAAHFGVGKVYNQLSEKDRSNVEMVESYVGKKIRSREFLDSYESAASILDTMERSLGLSRYNGPYHRIERLAEYLKVTGVN